MMADEAYTVLGVTDGKQFRASAAIRGQALAITFPDKRKPRWRQAHVVVHASDGIAAMRGAEKDYWSHTT